jgi:hypothetical protein
MTDCTDLPLCGAKRCDVDQTRTFGSLAPAMIVIRHTRDRRGSHICFWRTGDPLPLASCHSAPDSLHQTSVVKCVVKAGCNTGTLAQIPDQSTRSTNNTRPVTVGTVKKSIDAADATWFVRNVRHVCDGGRRRRVNRRETVRSRR